MLVFIMDTFSPRFLNIIVMHITAYYNIFLKSVHEYFYSTVDGRALV